MSRYPTDAQTEKQPLTQRLLDVVERAGNILPHPVFIFVLFSGLVLILSDVICRLGINATILRADGSVDFIQATSLLSAAGIRYLFSSAVTNFTGFAPLGTVLVAMLGVGVAEQTG